MCLRTKTTVLGNLQKDLNVWFLSLRHGFVVTHYQAKIKLERLIFQVKTCDSLCNDRIFLSFKRLRYDFASHKSQEKKAFLHFFAFRAGFRRYCCQTFDFLCRNHSRAISNFPKSKLRLCNSRFYKIRNLLHFDLNTFQNIQDLLFQR